MLTLFVINFLILNNAMILTHSLIYNYKKLDEFVLVSHQTNKLIIGNIFNDPPNAV